MDRLYKTVLFPVIKTEYKLFAVFVKAIREFRCSSIFLYDRWKSSGPSMTWASASEAS